MTVSVIINLYKDCAYYI